MVTIPDLDQALDEAARDFQRAGAAYTKAGRAYMDAVAAHGIDSRQARAADRTMRPLARAYFAAQNRATDVARAHYEARGN